MHIHTARHSIKLTFMLDTFLRQLLLALLERIRKRHTLWKIQCAEQYLLKTVYIYCDAYHCFYTPHETRHAYLNAIYTKTIV